MQDALKTNKIWVWTALDKDYSEILEFVIGDRSAESFEQLWIKVKDWNCYFWITDGYKVYPTRLGRLRDRSDEKSSI